MSATAGFIRNVWLVLDDDGRPDRYPFNLPVVRALEGAPGLELSPGVTFLIGENGSGKSTLLEAVAVAAGFNAEGGTRNFRFSTRPTDYELSGHLRLRRSPRKPRTGFFLRAESYYNVATEIERLDVTAAYGGSPHERSHGESFLDLVVHRFGRDGLYLLDEPEAALSVRGAMALLARIHELVGQDCQFIIATHSPILLALPGATIVQLDESGPRKVHYDEAAPVDLTRAFLADPGRFLQVLLESS